jgi:hypothetical protein
MAFVRDYLFNDMSRVGDDNCYLDQRNIENMKGTSYMTTNYFMNDPMMSNAYNTALNFPGMNLSGGHSISASGHNIDVNSKLLIEQESTNPKCRLTLIERPFRTVPFLGRGHGNNPDLESELLQGDMIRNKKSLSTTTEKSHIPHRHTPLVDSLASTIQNPYNLVEGVAHKGWVRGGLPSREHSKYNTN